MKNTKKKAVLQEYKTLEDIKQEFLDEYKQNDVLYQKDVMDAVEHLAMTDTDFDDLFQWFSDNDIEVKNVSIPSLPENVDIVVTHKSLTDRAIAVRPNAIHYSVENFLEGEQYDAIIEKIKETR